MDCQVELGSREKMVYQVLMAMTVLHNTLNILFQEKVRMELTVMVVPAAAVAVAALVIMIVGD